MVGLKTTEQMVCTLYVRTDDGQISIEQLSDFDGVTKGLFGTRPPGCPSHLGYEAGGVD